MYQAISGADTWEALLPIVMVMVMSWKKDGFLLSEI